MLVFGFGFANLSPNFLFGFLPNSSAASATSSKGCLCSCVEIVRHSQVKKHNNLTGRGTSSRVEHSRGAGEKPEFDKCGHLSSRIRDPGLLGCDSGLALHYVLEGRQ